MRPLPALCLGLLLGASSTWFALRTASSAADSAPIINHQSSIINNWSWRDSATPPLLARDASAAAISAWLALRSPEGGAPSYALRASSLRALVVRLPAEAFPRLVESLLPSAGDDDQRLLHIAFSVWTGKDADAATRWVATLPAVDSDEFLRSLASEAIATWSAKDADAPAAWACALPDPAIARQFASPALAALAAQNPTRALALARSRDDEFRQAVFPAMLDALGKHDPAGTLRTFAPELWKNGAGFNTLRPLIAAWMKQDTPTALAWLLTQPAKGHELSEWLYSLDRSADWHVTVADTIASTPGVADRPSALRDLLSRWSRERPEEALAWLEGLPDADLRINLLEHTTRDYSRAPEKMLPLALALPAGAIRTDRLSHILGAWAKLDSAATLAWMRDHAADPGISSASATVHGTLLGDLAREDPQAALAEWQALSDPKTRLAAIHYLALAWGQKDPAAALQWSEAERTKLSPRSYGATTDGLLSLWAKTEPEAALRWVEDWAARRPEKSDHFIMSYLKALGGTWAERYPRAATADLYTQIQDPALRAETLTRHVQEWLTKDPAAAKAWLEKSTALTPAQAAALLSP